MTIMVRVSIPFSAGQRLKEKREGVNYVYHQN